MENFWAFMDTLDWWVANKPFIWYKMGLVAFAFIFIVLACIYGSPNCNDGHEGRWIRLGGYRCKRCMKKHEDWEKDVSKKNL